MRVNNLIERKNKITWNNGKGEERSFDARKGCTFFFAVTDGENILVEDFIDGVALVNVLSSEGEILATMDCRDGIHNVAYIDLSYKEGELCVYGDFKNGNGEWEQRRMAFRNGKFVDDGRIRY